MRESVALPISRNANGARELGMTALIASAAALIAALAGAFGTLHLPIGARLFLFAFVIGLNSLKWLLWLRLFPQRDRPTDRIISELGGALLLNLTLVFELELALGMLGRPVDLPFWPVYAIATVISLIVGATIAVVRTAIALPPAEAIVAPSLPVMPAFLKRVGIDDPAALLALEAEDHYVRLHLADGRKPLLLHGFGAALEELAPLAGLRVHRGAWIAEGAVASAERVGRKWRLLLRDGTAVAVSDTYLPQVRAQGWLAARYDA